jgi:hypothetical protein
MRRMRVRAFVAGMASLGDGFASLAKGMGSIFAPAPPPRRLRQGGKTIDQILAGDRAALARDWDEVAADMRRAGIGSPGPSKVRRPTKGRTLK